MAGARQADHLEGSSFMSETDEQRADRMRAQSEHATRVHRFRAAARDADKRIAGWPPLTDEQRKKISLRWWPGAESAEG
jgi:hypothetical protein